MKFSDLNKIDIREIRLSSLDMAALKHRVQAISPDKLVNIGVVAFSLLICLFIYKGKSQKLNELNAQIKELEAKTQIIQDYNKLEKEIFNYIDNAPEFLNSNRVIRNITDYAVQHQIKILSYSPAQKVTTILYDMEKTQFNISSANLSNILRFVRVLEKSNLGMRVESLTISKDDGSRRNFGRGRAVDNEDKESEINAVMDIVSISLKKK